MRNAYFLNRLTSPVLAAFVAAVICVAAPVRALAAEPAMLDKTIAEVKDRWSDIRHMPADEFEAMRAKDETVLFDVRTPAEYAVSHIEGAIRVEPGISATDFMAAHGAALKGRTAVFYCSVGMRSSKFAERVKDAAIQTGVAGVANLEGGIFAWHRDRRPLVDGKGATPSIHPYDRTWGKAVARPADIATDARK